MGAHSKRKGKAGEREVAAQLRHIWPDARRGIQSRGGGAEIPDVEVPCFHVEVKRQSRPNIPAAVRQAMADAAPGKWPVAWTRADRGEWLVTMRAEDWLELVGAWWVETRRGS